MAAHIIALLTASALLFPAATLAQQDAGQSFDSNGVPIYYVDIGRGAPVVLLHGFTGSYAHAAQARQNRVRRERSIAPWQRREEVS